MTGDLSPPLVKICGIKSVEAARWTVEAGADLIGFVFFEKSPRALTPEAVGPVAKAAGTLERVGLFVDADDVLLGSAIEAGRLDCVQLHGRETPERAAEISKTFGVKVMKAIGVQSDSDIKAADAFKGAVDRMLYDAKPPKLADRPGGLGEVFDWSLLEHAPDIPYLVAGGLSRHNVRHLWREVAQSGACIGVDVSSHVERAPGVKDEALIKAFVSAARGAYE